MEYTAPGHETNMLRRLIVILPLFWCAAAFGAEVTDSTGRAVQVPAEIAHVLPAGPPAAILLEAIAPDLMVGWPGPLSDEASGLLPNSANHPRIPRLTGHEDVTEKIKALKPDLILDYGEVTPRYFDLARAVQQKTGVPTLLFAGPLDKIPLIVRQVGVILHRQARAETLATYFEALLALPVLPLPSTFGAHPRVLYARGVDGLTVTAPDTDVTEVFKHLGWQVLAPEGQGTFRKASIAAIAALDPDILIFSDPAMRDTLKQPDWQTLRAVRDGHALVAPALPFGWVEEPPSINRLLGLAWLGGHEPATLAATFNAVVYGRALTPAQLDTVLDGVHSLQQ
jgi:iron complex transport system substrate-binding protein